jgi:hypothetical protein
MDSVPMMEIQHDEICDARFVLSGIFSEVRMKG